MAFEIEVQPLAETQQAPPLEPPPEPAPTPAPVAPPSTQAVAAQQAALGNLGAYRQTNGQYDIARALGDGIDRGAIVSAGFDSRQVGQLQRIIRTQRLIEDATGGPVDPDKLLAGLKSGAITQDDLNQLGITARQVKELTDYAAWIAAQKAALDSLKDYRRGDGYNLVGARRAGVSPETFRAAGFREAEIENIEATVRAVPEGGATIPIGPALPGETVDRNVNVPVAVPQELAPRQAPLTAEELAARRPLEEGERGDLTPEELGAAGEVAQSLIPIYGTYHTWRDSPNWVRGVSVASDILTIVPIVGEVSAGVRGGLTGGRIATRVGVLTAKSVVPYEAVLHPYATAKGTARGLTDFLDPGRVGNAVVETRADTIRFQGYAHPRITGASEVLAPEEITRGQLTPTELKSAVDVATQEAVAGRKAIGPIEGKDLSVAFTTPAIQRVTGAGVFNTSPDLRNIMAGTTVRESKEVSTIGAEAGKPIGMFTAPHLISEFTDSTAFGKMPELSEEAKTAIALGQLPDKPVSGAIFIRDPEILAKLKSTGKTYAGTAEAELQVPPGVALPVPSQFIRTRNIYGVPATIAVIGKPFTRAEILRLKLIGPAETVAGIFRSPGSFVTRETELFNAGQQSAKRAEALATQANQAKKAGDSTKADALFAEANREGSQAARAFDQARTIGTERTLTGLRPGAFYYGRQDIGRAIQELGRETPQSSIGREQIEVAPTARSGAGRVPTEEPPRTVPPEPRVPNARIPTPATGRPTTLRVPSTTPPPPIPVVPSPSAKTPPPVLPPFKLPGGRRLPPGVYPKVVRYPAGIVDVTVDLESGERSYQRRRPTGQRPREGLQVVSTTDNPPEAQEFQQGNQRVRVNAQEISFHRRRRVF